MSARREAARTDREFLPLIILVPCLAFVAAVVIAAILVEVLT